MADSETAIDVSERMRRILRSVAESALNLGAVNDLVGDSQGAREDRETARQLGQLLALYDAGACADMDAAELADRVEAAAQLYAVRTAENVITVGGTS